jgi:hypothetical protein
MASSLSVIEPSFAYPLDRTITHRRQLTLEGWCLSWIHPSAAQGSQMNSQGGTPVRLPGSEWKMDPHLNEGADVARTDDTPTPETSHDDHGIPGQALVLSSDPRAGRDVAMID